MSTSKPDPDLSLSELVATATSWLDRADLDVADDRVNVVPDARTVRYYQSTGLVDKPRGYDGRKAIYGRRHLMQVVCVKLLQARGFKLSQIQTALAGATDATLESAVVDGIPGLFSSTDTPGGAPVDAAAVAPTTLTPLRAFQLAPGVVLTIDPAVVADPDALARLLQLHLTQRGSE
ncbi:MAG: DNA-binding transcriptional MerR regulator [Kiritimatiellia bacterium]|jgi:DNA-binding transcriptional MerR regulator